MSKLKWAATLGLPIVMIGLLVWYVGDPKLFLEYVKVLVWPAAVVAVAWRFRDLLSGKLRQLVELNFFGQAARFALEEKSTEALNEELEEPANVLVSWPPFPRDKAPDADVESADREADEQKRRESFEDTLRQGAEWGWRMARVGADAPPKLQVTWDEDGKPHIRAPRVWALKSSTWRDALRRPSPERDLTDLTEMLRVFLISTPRKDGDSTGDEPRKPD